jgi:hypothetical protein
MITVSTSFLVNFKESQYGQGIARTHNSSDRCTTLPKTPHFFERTIIQHTSL